MIIRVRCREGTRRYDVAETSTILQLKQMIEDDLKVSVRKQLLSWNPEYDPSDFPNDSQTMLESHLNNGDMLWMTVEGEQASPVVTEAIPTKGDYAGLPVDDGHVLRAPTLSTTGRCKSALRKCRATVSGLFCCCNSPVQRFKAAFAALDISTKISVGMCSLFGIVCNLIPLLPIVIIVAAYWHETCDQPIRVFLLVEAFILSANVILAVVFVRKLMQNAGSAAQPADAEQGAAAAAQPQMMAAAASLRRISRLIWGAFVIVFILSTVWSFVGQRWTWSNTSCSETAPHMYMMSVAFYSINYILGFAACCIIPLICFCAARRMALRQQQQQGGGGPARPGAAPVVAQPYYA